MNEKFWIPRTLDAPPLFFMWEADSAVLIIVIMLLFAMLDMFVMGLFLAFMAGRGYAYLKEEGGKGLITKLLYWYTPSEWWASKRYASFIRSCIG